MSGQYARLTPEQLYKALGGELARLDPAVPAGGRKPYQTRRAAWERAVALLEELRSRGIQGRLL